MYTRVLTYDLKSKSSEDYKKLYEFFDEIKSEKITESSYKTTTSLNWQAFKDKIISLTCHNDNVQACVVNEENELKVWKIR